METIETKNQDICPHHVYGTDSTPLLFLLPWDLVGISMHKALMILWFITKDIYFVFITVSGTELLKSLEFPKWKSYKVVFCYVNETTFGTHLKVWAGYQENQSHDSVQFSSVAKSCLTLCDPMDCSTAAGLPVHHPLLELTQTHVHWIGDAIQSSHPLLSPSPPTFNISQHQGLFKWVSSLHQVAKGLEFQFQHQSFQWIFRTDFL